MARRTARRASRLSAVVALTAAAAACAKEAAPIPYDSMVAPTIQSAPPTVASAGDVISPVPDLGLDPELEAVAEPAASDALGASAPTPSTAPVVTVPPDAVGDVWTDATTDLVGLESECGNVGLVAARPGTPEVIAGIATQGLWSSTDGAATWTPLGAAEGSETITNRTSSIVFDPDDPDTYWESGTYNGNGVYRTDDGGQTFTALGDITHTDHLAVDFSDPERQLLIVGRHETSELYRSVDGGETWEDISSGLPGDVGYVTSPVIVDSSTILVGTRESEGAGIFASVDGGDTWTQVYAGGIAGLPLQSASGSWYWLRDDGAGMIVSHDGGETWSEAGGSGLSWNADAVVELPDERLVSFSSTGLLASRSFGLSWEPLGPPLPYEPNGFTYSPEDGAFYVWKFDCNFDGATSNDVPAEAILRLEFTPADAAT